MSYLSGSYLEDDVPEFDAGNATVALSPALGDDPGAGAVITLPGGIQMPRKTFYALLALLALLIIIALIRRARSNAASAA